LAEAIVDGTLTRMTAKRAPGLFITGTCTGVGKTYVAAAIARQLTAAGCSVGVYKPVLSGVRSDPPAPAWADRKPVDDDELLWEAAGRIGELARVACQRFQAPLAPHLAARREGATVNYDRLREGIEYWRGLTDFLLVEGAGGLLSPVTDDRYVADLVADFGYPLVIVAANRLGTINQTLQTVLAAAHFGRGLPVAAVVLNDVSRPDGTDLSNETNGPELERRLSVPLTRLAYDGCAFCPAVDWLARAAESGGTRNRPPAPTVTGHP
jgi:dethiobiotin synthetase